MVLTEEERKESRKIASKKYSQSKKGKESNKIKSKKYHISEKGKKALTKSSWKTKGLNMDNFEEIYERYTNAIFCDICECVLNVEGDYNSKKCMDHDHDTGDFRNIVCDYCNLYICK